MRGACVLIVMMLSAAPARADDDVCREAWQTGDQRRTLTLQLRRPTADLAPWCERLFRYLAPPGHPWPDDLAQHLQTKLRDAGIFTDAACVTRAPSDILCMLAPRQVVVDVDAEEVPFPLLERDVERRYYLHSGAPVPDPKERAQLEQRLRAYLEDEGFLEPEITITTNEAPLEGEPAQGVAFEIRVTGTEGRALGRVDSSAPKVVPTERARDAVEHEWLFGIIDRRFRPEVFRDDVTRLQDELRAEGWPEAVVEGHYAIDPWQPRVDVYLDVRPGRRLRVRFEGAVDVDADELEESMRFAEVGAVDALACDRSAAAMVTRLQREGYHEAEVTCDLRLGGKDALATFVLIPGPKVRLEEIDVTGNRHFTDDEVRSRSELASLRSGWFSDAVWVDTVVEEDAARVLAFYHQRGFADAEVTPRKEVLPSGGLRLVLHVVEGKATMVSDIALRVSDPKVTVKFSPEMGPGDPFQAGEVGNQRQALARALANDGYLRAEIDSRVVPDGEGRVRVEHHITPGPRRYLGGLFITGAIETSHSLLRRELGLRPGDLVTLEDLQDAERRLYNLHIFSSVELEPVPADPGEPMWLRLDVREHDAFFFDLALGFSTDNLFVIGFDAHHGNLLGYGIRIDASLRFANASEIGLEELRIGNRDEARLALRAPHPFNAPFDVHLEGTYILEDQDLYYAREITATLALSRVILELESCPGCPRIATRGGYRLSATDLELPVDIEVNDALLVEATAGRVFLEGDVAFVDSLTDPRRGYRFALMLELAHPYLAPFLNTNSAFYRTALRTAGYFPIALPPAWRSGDGHALSGPLVLAGSLDLGWAGPWPGQGILPLSETFYYGGDNSLRGAEPRASLVAEPQGRFLVRGSAELRWYVLDNWSFGAVQLALFSDAASVARYFDDLFCVTTVSTGLVVRYITPIGPLALAYGWAVLRPAEITNVRPDVLPPAGRFHLTFGSTF